MVRKFTRICALLLAIALTACVPAADPEPKKTIRIGVALYDQYDTFIGELTNHLTTYAQRMEQETGVTITILRESADGSQEAQNNQVESFIQDGCDVLCVNLVDRMDASVIIDKADSAGLPIVFFNRELVEEDLSRSANLYYVGADASESGRMQGEIVADIIRGRFEGIDKNGDSTFQYVMLEGEAEHQDAIVRTESAIKAVEDAGFQLERLESEIAKWMRSQAETKMSQFLETHGRRIELVFANNDDMALGAVDALKRAGIPPADWPVVVGIDGTAVGLEAVILGELSGTVYNDSPGQAKALLDLSFALATGGELPPLEDGRYIRLPYQPITADNVSDFLPKPAGAS